VSPASATTPAWNHRLIRTLRPASVRLMSPTSPHKATSRRRPSPPRQSSLNCERLNVPPRTHHARCFGDSSCNGNFHVRWHGSLAMSAYRAHLCERRYGASRVFLLFCATLSGRQRDDHHYALPELLQNLNARYAGATILLQAPPARCCPVGETRKNSHLQYGIVTLRSRSPTLHQCQMPLSLRVWLTFTFLRFDI